MVNKINLYSPRKKKLQTTREPLASSPDYRQDNGWSTRISAQLVSNVIIQTRMMYFNYLPFINNNSIITNKS
jgi:hypothetical protein